MLGGPQAVDRDPKCQILVEVNPPSHELTLGRVVEDPLLDSSSLIL